MNLDNFTSVFDNIKEQLPGSIEKVKGWFIALSDYILSMARENTQIGYILIALLVLIALLFAFRGLKRLKNGFSINSIVYLILFSGTSYVTYNIYTNLFK